MTSSYNYDPFGRLDTVTAAGTLIERNVYDGLLSQVTHKDDGTKENAYYGYNSHTDVETLTDDSGDTKATYGYTAYGSNDDAQFTGIDKPDAADPTKESYNPYRFNAKRWDQNSQSYDMGFRDYSPGLNRFLSRDSYNGALADMQLGLNPFTGNRYAFGGGNPISIIEDDGHTPYIDDFERTSVNSWMYYYYQNVRDIPTSGKAEAGYGYGVTNRTLFGPQPFTTRAETFLRWMTTFAVGAGLFPERGRTFSRTSMLRSERSTGSTGKGSFSPETLLLSRLTRKGRHRARAARAAMPRWQG